MAVSKQVKARTLLLILLLIIVVLLSNLCQHMRLLLAHTILALRLRALVPADVLSVAILISVDHITAKSLEIHGDLWLLLVRNHRLGVLADCRMHFGVKSLQVVSRDSSLDELGEVVFVLVGIVRLHCLHVVTHVPSEDAITVLPSVVLLAVRVVAEELLLGVWDLKATVKRTL